MGNTEVRNRIEQADVRTVEGANNLDTRLLHLDITNGFSVTSVTTFTHSTNIALHDLTIDDFKRIKVACEKAIEKLNFDGRLHKVS